ncbi:MAG: hypothetical protein ACN2B6_11085 [Rickettsiales bacterium]
MTATAKPSGREPSVTQASSVQKQEKKDRLAKALRNNLLRRKAAASKQE